VLSNGILAGLANVVGAGIIPEPKKSAIYKAMLDLAGPGEKIAADARGLGSTAYQT